MKLVDKMKKLKDSLYIRSNKELTEDKGAAPEIHSVVDSDDGRSVAGFVKKDGKLVEASATSDAQDSGAYEDAAKKIGISPDDLVYTSPSMAAAQAFVSEKKDSKDKKSERVLGEKAKMVKSDTLHPKSVAALHADGELDNEKVAMKHASMHNAIAMTSKDRESRSYHHKQVRAITDHVSGIKKYVPERPNLKTESGATNKQDSLRKDAKIFGAEPTVASLKTKASKPAQPKEHTLNYAEINKISPKKEGPDLDYSTHKITQQPPRWKQLREAALNKQRATLEAKLKTEGVGVVKKSEVLQKDDKSDIVNRFRAMLDAAARSKNSPGSGGKKTGPDTRSREQKIKDALAAQDRHEPVTFAPNREPETPKSASERFQERIAEGHQRKLQDAKRQLYRKMHGDEALAEHEMYHKLASENKDGMPFRPAGTQHKVFHFGSDKDGKHYFYAISRKVHGRAYVVEKDKTGSPSIRPIHPMQLDHVFLKYPYSEDKEVLDASKIDTKNLYVGDPSVNPSIAKSILSHPSAMTLFGKKSRNAGAYSKKDFHPIKFRNDEQGRARSVHLDRKYGGEPDERGGIGFEYKDGHTYTHTNPDISDEKAQAIFDNVVRPQLPSHLQTASFKPRKPQLKVVKSLDKSAPYKKGLGIGKIKEMMRRWKAKRNPVG